MTAFRPGDLAVVTGDTAGWGHGFHAGAVVEIKYAHVTYDTARDTGYDCRWRSGPAPKHGDPLWSVAIADLQPYTPTPEPEPTPAPSPLDRLITAVLEGRVSIEQQWRDIDRTTYRFVIEEKA